MRLAGPEIIGELRDKLPVGVGRHLYAVLGAYAQLARFEQAHLAQARDPEGHPLPVPLNVNRELLARIGDEELRQLVRDEPRRPQAVQRRLNQELQGLLNDRLATHWFLILRQLELLFAYELDLTAFRTRASNQSHILLLLPGERRGDHITIFHEADARFHRTLPENLIADNHLWELTHA
jgi:hypothetical protein